MAAPASAPRLFALSEKRRDLVLRLSGIALVIALWWVLSRFLPERTLPTPEATLINLPELLGKGILPVYIADSVRHLVIGCLLGILIGLPLGIGVGLNRYVARFFYPLLNFFQSVGGIVWLPLFLIWFGFTETTIYAAVIYTAVFPVAFNTLVGVRGVPRVFIHAASTLGASPLRIIRDVILPGALPNIVTGIRLGLAFGWRALVGAEILVGASGLGFMIFDAQAFGAISRLIFGMLIIGSLWLVLDHLLLRPIEAATIERWNLVRS